MSSNAPKLWSLVRSPAPRKPPRPATVWQSHLSVEPSGDTIPKEGNQRLKSTDDRILLIGCWTGLPRRGQRRPRSLPSVWSKHWMPTPSRTCTRMRWMRMATSSQWAPTHEQKATPGALPAACPGVHRVHVHRCAPGLVSPGAGGTVRGYMGERAHERHCVAAAHHMNPYRWAAEKHVSIKEGRKCPKKRKELVKANLQRRAKHLKRQVQRNSLRAKLETKGFYYDQSAATRQTHSLPRTSVPQQAVNPHHPQHPLLRLRILLLHRRRREVQKGNNTKQPENKGKVKWHLS